ncbi:MAG: protein kinase, partial [Acidobacteriota bacterium]|nr:protein kinase [Acidobacteriota bacterium]
MPVTPGTRLGPYEIVSRIGAGGMGEVYKARDTRLDRIVAVKISKEQFSERFEREAQAIAALNHPNICQLYDVGPNYLVMEYIEGQPLKGPLPLDIALKYATQICDALEAAHKKGISHRDLKPENILVTKPGIKLLDFGLAKRSFLPEAGEATQTIALTQENSILGTLQYMAPEQLEGKPADARSDIFAFGAVLYELVTGRRAFVGKSSASLISAIMSSQPAPMSELQPIASPALERVVTTCLAKDPEERWQSARDVKHAIECVALESSKPARAATRSSNHREWAAYAVALCLAAALAFMYLHRTGGQTANARMLFTLQPPEKAAFIGGSAPAISPDGSRVVAAGRSTENRNGLWIRPLDSLGWQPVPDTYSASRPAWSPNGQSLVFVSLTRLQKVDLSGGPSQTLCSGYNFSTPSWGATGVILVALRAGPLYRVEASGGSCAPATKLDSAQGEIGHHVPKFLPDGRHFLFLSRAANGSGIIWAGSLDSNERIRLMSSSGGASYAGPPSGPGHLLYEKEGIAVAHRFDPVRLQLSGEPVPIPG